MSTEVFTFDVDKLPPSSKAALAFTKSIHHTSCPSIAPSRPELSQGGKTVLVAGGSAGVGLNIVRSFAAAAAARLILVSRRRSVLDAAVVKLQTEFPDKSFIGRSIDANYTNAVAILWAKLAEVKILVDVVTVASADVPPPHTMLSLGTAQNGFISNVRTPLLFAEKLYKQAAREAGQKLQVAKDVPVEDMQVVSFHPGLYWTESAQKTGITRQMSPFWDD
ncbi:hypothetical protein ACHAQA_007280, partial [Verticillium albo-atrum]